MESIIKVYVVVMQIVPKIEERNEPISLEKKNGMRNAASDDLPWLRFFQLLTLYMDNLKVFIQYYVTYFLYSNHTDSIKIMLNTCILNV